MALLGIKDELLDSSTASWNVNKIGGLSDWIHPDSIKPVCPCCKSPMLLIVQLNCPLDGSPYHRTLYLFTCPRRECWGRDESWCVLRSQFLDSSYKKHSQQAKLEKKVDLFTCEDDWGDDVDDPTDDFTKTEAGKQQSAPKSGGYSSNNCSSSEFDEIAITEGALSNKFEELRFQDDEQVEEEQEEVKEDISVDDCEKEDEVTKDDQMVIPDDSLHNAFQLIENGQETCNDMDEGPDPSSDILISYYLSVVEEHSVPADDNGYLKKLLNEYQRNEGVDLEGLLSSEYFSSDKNGGQSGNEKYERTEIKHGDKVFHRFRKQTAVCPQQCVRYHWNGCPLFIKELSPSERSTYTNRSCPSCGGDVVFELQLMPALVNFLQTSEKAGPATEFGTVIVFTCKNSCWDDKSTTKQELVLVQPDPDHHLFR